MSVSVSITITAKQDKFGELQARILANLPDTRAFRGNEMVRLLSPEDKPVGLLLLEEWATIEDFHQYKAWRAETGSSALGPELLAFPAEVVVSEILF